MLSNNFMRSLEAGLSHGIFSSDDFNITTSKTNAGIAIRINYKYNPEYHLIVTINANVDRFKGSFTPGSIVLLEYFDVATDYYLLDKIGN